MVKITELAGLPPTVKVHWSGVAGSGPKVTVTSAVGCELSFTVKEPVSPASEVSPSGLVVVMPRVSIQTGDFDLSTEGGEQSLHQGQAESAV